MYKVTCQYNRWRIIRESNIILSGIGGFETAVNIAKLYDIHLSEFCDLKTMRVA